MTVLPSRRSPLRVCALAASLAAWVAAAAATAPARAAEPVDGEVRLENGEGFIRLAFRFAQPVPAAVRLAWPVLIISFQKPVAVAVDGLRAAAPQLIGAARRDPDGMAIRIALKQKVRINTIPAAERYYVDLLPEDWHGVLPGLPLEVVKELAERARAAEQALRRREAEAPRKPPLVRVQVAMQPTFSRYVFDLPDTANAAPERGEETFVLRFDQPIQWDLADALAALPSTVKTIKAESDESSSRVTFELNGTPDVRSFREEHSVVVDVSHEGAKPSIASLAHDTAPPSPLPGLSAPAAAPAATEPAKVEEPPGRAAETDAGKAAPNPPPAPPEADLPPPPPPRPDGAVVVHVTQNSNGLRLEFPFVTPTPAAAFIRAGTAWLVFDTAAKIDLSALVGHANDGVRAASASRGSDGEAVIRLSLSRPQLMSLKADGSAWIVTVADSLAGPPQPLAVARSIVGKDRANIVIPFAHPGRLFRIADPEIGDRLTVVTALAPVRGFVRSQDYVELRLLASAQGVAVQPLADDVTATLTENAVILTRPGGLSLSSAPVRETTPAPPRRDVLFDPQQWDLDARAEFRARQAELVRAAAAAPPGERQRARLDLARFYLAQGMAAEAKGVLDVTLADASGPADVTGSVLSAIADVLLGRSAEALKLLDRPPIGDQLGARVWRAMALAREGRWVEAHAGFRNLDRAIAGLPIELQRRAMMTALKAAIETGDFAEASNIADELHAVGLGAGERADFAVLTGRLKEGLGRTDDALADYRAAAASAERPAAARGRLREIALRLKTGKLGRDEAIDALETLTTVWRGDETELAGLRLLTHLYVESGRYRDAFHAMRTALLVFPNSDTTRKIQEEAAAAFKDLFLSAKSEALKPIDALALFYDYRELTPIGRSGDEMIRRLADRLTAVDLLDQAAELLQHQIDHRLSGAARTQVAARLAAVYLMARKPDRALEVLKRTRSSDIAEELRTRRLLLEARALSDLGRHDLALELIANVESPQAERLRADILWAAKRWRAAAEQIERLYGDRWKQPAPLDERERFDVLRAAIGYALADEALSLARLRERYAQKMQQGPDAHAFEVVSAPIGAGSGEFQDVARRIAATDTLDAFLADMRKRYPDQPAPADTAAQDKAAAAPPAAAAPRASPPPAGADARPTGAIARRAP